jgi:Icc-related predicted phosphoesterase
MILPSRIRIAAVGDLHVKKASQGQLQPVFAEVAERADVLLLCGDLTDLGHPEEARVLAREIAGVSVPVLAVLGNHDVESNREEEVVQILEEAGVTVLDGDLREIKGVVFAGVKGFCGGFGRHTLEPWGEPALKSFVQAAIAETMRLEMALARVRSTPCVALLHYAPVVDTVAGEPPEIYPWLGSSRLEEPIDRYGVTMVFHGHAHRGSPEGRTRGGVPVYNVALPLLRRIMPDQPPFRVVEVSVAVDGRPVEAPAAMAAPAAAAATSAPAELSPDRRPS